MKRLFTLFVATLFLLPVFLYAQEEKVDTEMIKKIRDEETNHSQVPMIAHYLTDVSGARLTNSPGYKRAANWCVSEFKKWGLANSATEPWGEFGTGWEIQKCYVALSAPYYQSFIAYPFAWSAGRWIIVSTRRCGCTGFSGRRKIGYNIERENSHGN